MVNISIMKPSTFPYCLYSNRRLFSGAICKIYDDYVKDITGMRKADDVKR